MSAHAPGIERAEELPSAPAAVTNGVPFNGETEREYLWRTFATLVSSIEQRAEPPFTSWVNEIDVFAPTGTSERAHSTYPGPPLISVAAGSAHYSTDAPVITFVHYNREAYVHIRAYRLYLKSELQRLAETGTPDAQIPTVNSVPRFPASAKILMTAWWPVAARGATALPVWDGDVRDRSAGSHDYTRWSRAVAVQAQPSIAGPVTIGFAGHEFAAAEPVSIADFYHRRVDARLAMLLQQDAESNKAAIIALGRPIRAGDFLLLVGLHLVSMASQSGVWGTLWWHDQPTEGPFAAGRPDSVNGAWAHYLMDVASDAVEPRSADGTPKICFNPWFEAKFPDGGQGSGVQSNCVNCHRRASYPKTEFLPIRRGLPMMQSDPAFARGRLLTQGLWSVANPAQASAPLSP